MDNKISMEERINRANEIYERRYKNNSKINNNYNLRNKKEKNVKNEKNNIRKKKKGITRKMAKQIIVCTLIYFIFYTLKSSNQIFSADIIDKAKEILAYDISIPNIYDKLVNNGKKIKSNQKNLNSKTNKEKREKEEISKIEGIHKELSKEDTLKKEENKEKNVNENKEEKNNEIEKIKDNENSKEIVKEKIENNEKNKTQEEIDIEYIKKNLNISWPLKGKITSRFGKRTPTKIVSAFHKGIDIAGDTGTNISSSCDGKVTMVSEEPGYGKFIKIENGEIATIYAHCSEILVKQNQEIKKGEIIAKVGATGRATGPHLHFEIRRQNRIIDPEKILGSM